MTIRILFRDTSLLPINVTVSPNGWADLSCDTLDVFDIEDGEEIVVAQFAKGDVLGWRMEREVPEKVFARIVETAREGKDECEI